MEPSISRSLKEGFKASQRSWMGMVWYAGCWIGIALVLLMGVMASNPPKELFEEPPAAVATTPAAGPGQTVEPNAPSAPTEAANRDRILNDWFKRSWPLLVACLLVLAVASIWLTGAQTGYLAEQVRTATAGWGAFASSGSQRLPALLGGWALSLLAFLAVLLVVGACVALVGVIPNSVPRFFSAGLALILGFGITAGAVWILVRISFWFIAIVADRLGPVAALKKSFAATRKRWWKVATLGLAMAALSYAVWIPSALLEWSGTALGGPLGIGIGLIGTIAGALASLYMGFLSLAASIRFYEDIKSADASTPPAANG